MKILMAIVVGLLTGVISGCGIGGGSLLILYLTAVIGMEQYSASGINLLYFLACAPTALVGHIRQKRVEWSAVWRCVPAGVLASVGAAVAASYISTDWLRRGFGVLLLYIGIKELFCKKEKTASRAK